MYHLTNVVSKLLNVSEPQARAILDLIQFEELFSQECVWREAKKMPDGQMEYLEHSTSSMEVVTQYDLFMLLQIIGQDRFFSGLDREATRKEKGESIAKRNAAKEYYLQIMKRLDLCSPQQVATDLSGSFCVIRGSDLKTVEKRVERLIEDIQKTGTIPFRVFGFGSNRRLGTGASSDEKIAYEQAFLRTRGLETMSEIDMVTHVVTERLLKLFPDIAYMPSNGGGPELRKNLTESLLANMVSLVIEEQKSRPQTPQPTLVYSYSTQPSIVRQARELQEQIGEQFCVEGLGQGVSDQEFLDDDTSIYCFLGEIARLIYGELKRVEKNPAKLNELQHTLLTLEEKKELDSMTGRENFIPVKESGSRSPTQLLHKDLFPPINNDVGQESMVESSMKSNKDQMHY